MSPPTHQELREQLARCSATELADLLVQLADQSTEVEKAVQTFLLRGDPKALARSLRSRIASVSRGTRFFFRAEVHALARRLEDLLSTIEKDLLPADPLLALRCLGAFLASDEKIYPRVDDSSGVIGDAYHEACRLLGNASTAANQPPEATELFLSLSSKNPYGTRDRLFDEAARIVAPDDLQAIVDEWYERYQEERGEPLPGIGVQLSAVARSMGRLSLFEETLLGGRSLEDVPLFTPQLVRVYLEHGQPETALDRFRTGTKSNHLFEYSAMLLELHAALPAHDEISRRLWEAFAASADSSLADAYLERLPAGERDFIRERMRQHVRTAGFSLLQQAEFFLAMGETATAAALLENGYNSLTESDSEYSLVSLARRLENPEPLAASLLYRAALASLLRTSNSRYYSRAVHYAKTLKNLSEEITDWKAAPPPERFWQQLREDHGRKPAFWKKLAQASLP